MSEQQAEQTSGESGSLSAGPSDSQSSLTPIEPVAAAAPEISVVASPPIAPDHEAPVADAPKVEAPKVEAPRVEMIKPEVPRLGKLMIMAPGERSFGNEHASGPKAEQVSPAPGKPGKRRFVAVAAMVALAIVAGRSRPMSSTIPKRASARSTRPATASTGSRRHRLNPVRNSPN